MLNPESPLPLYHQLAELLKARIDRRELLPGARLPSEPELSRVHGVGRPTVRMALGVLAERGLIERRRGSGTFVRQAPVRVDLFSLAGTLSSFARGGVELESSIVERARLRAVPRDADNPFSERTAYTFTRLGKVRGRTVLFEALFLDAQTFPDFPRLKLGSLSLSRLVEERYFLRPSHADQTFRVAKTKEAVRGVLELGAREAILHVKRTLHFPSAPKAIFSELYCRTDEFAFSQTIGTTNHG